MFRVKTLQSPGGQITTTHPSFTLHMYNLFKFGLVRMKAPIGLPFNFVVKCLLAVANFFPICKFHLKKKKISCDLHIYSFFYT